MSSDAKGFTGAYSADPIHSSVSFAVRYMGVSTFRANFDAVSATLKVRPDGMELVGAVDVGSVSIHRPEQFRAHVLGPEFFDADAHPEITFSASDVLLSEDGSATVRGTLTIRGNARQVEAHGTWSPPTSDPAGKIRSHLALGTAIDRRDFGITWDAQLPNGAGALDDEVTITVDLALVAKD